MPDGVGVGFAVDSLRVGGEVAGLTAADADAVAARIAGLVPVPEMFGRVDQAGPLAAVLTAARDGYRGMAEQVREVHLDLSLRLQDTAGQADLLVDTTTALAQRAPRPGP